MRPPKDFFTPLAVCAPEPPRRIPALPSRTSHFLDPSDERTAARVPGLVRRADVLFGNIEDAGRAARGSEPAGVYDSAIRDAPRHPAPHAATNQEAHS